MLYMITQFLIIKHVHESQLVGNLARQTNPDPANCNSQKGNISLTEASLEEIQPISMINLIHLIIVNPPVSYTHLTLPTTPYV